MKAYHLVIATSGDEASPLHFLDRSDASRYQKILLWPWEHLGHYQAPNGEIVPLAKIQFRVEPVVLPGIYDPDLDWIVWRKNKQLGYAPLVPGRCFDPSAWHLVTDQDRRDPVLSPKLAHAERELDQQNK